MSKARVLRLEDGRTPTKRLVTELDYVIMDAKLKRFDNFTLDAVAYIVEWLQEHPEQLIAIGRARYILGHYRWGDQNWGELTEDDLVAEASEELGDAICYLARRFWLRQNSGFT